MELSGFSLSQVLPAVRNPSGNRNLHKLFHVPEELCGVTWTHVLCSAFCSVLQKTKHFKQLLTASPPILLPFPPNEAPFFFPLFDEVSYSASDSFGFRGIIFKRRSHNKV